MTNFEKGKKYISFVLGGFLIWILISLYWYVCLIKGFCQTENNLAVNTVKKTEVQEKNKVINEINFEETKFIPINHEKSEKEEKKVTTKKKIKTRTEVIKCMTYLNSDIKPNSKNNFVSEVKKLEEFLNKYSAEKLEINGIYEAEDIGAVKRFQKKNNLSQDGIVGVGTRKVINVIYCIKNRKNN